MEVGRAPKVCKQHTSDQAHGKVGGHEGREGACHTEREQHADQTLANWERVLRGSQSPSRCFSTLFPLRKTYDLETAWAGQILWSDSSQTFLTRILSFIDYLSESVSSDNCENFYQDICFPQLALEAPLCTLKEEFKISLISRSLIIWGRWHPVEILDTLK